MQIFDNFEGETRRLYFCVLPEDVNDELESLKRIELLLSSNEAVLLDHLQVKDVIDEA